MATSETPACIHTVTMTGGNTTHTVWQFFRTCVIQLCGALFLPCAFVSDAVCDLCCHKCGQWPRAVGLINCLRWPLSYACTISVLTYSVFTIARPSSTGVCVCV